MKKKISEQYLSLLDIGPRRTAFLFPRFAVIVRAGIRFSIAAMMILAVFDSGCAAKANKAKMSIGNPAGLLSAPGLENNHYYRGRIRDLMKKENYLLSQWRIRRGYPYSDRAMRMIHAGHNTEALRIYTTYLEKDPQNLLMQWERLVLLGTMQSPLETEATASEFLRIVPGFGPVLILRAFARTKLGRLHEAETDWEAALQDKQLTPEDRAMVLGQLSFAAYQRGDLELALRRCEQWMTATADDTAPHVFYAGLLEEKGCRPAAIAQWRRIARMDASELVRRRSVLARGVLLQEVQKPQAAFALLMIAREQSLFDGPQVPASQQLEFAHMLARLAEKTGHIDIAVQTLHNLPGKLVEEPERLALARLFVLQSEPDKIITLLFGPPPISLTDVNTLAQILDLIRLLDHKGFTATADDLMAKSLPAVRLRFLQNRHASQARHLWIDYLAARADISRKHGRWKSAADTLARLVRLTGQYQYQMDYAALLMAADKPEPAIAVLARTARRADLSPEQQTLVYCALAAALSQCGRHAEAARAWHRAYLSSDNPSYGLYSGQAYLKAGDFQSAEASLESFPEQRLKPAEQLAWYEMAGQIWRQRGRLEKSLQAWQCAAALSSRPYYAYQVSDTLAAMNQLKAADAILAKVLRLNPREWEALQRRAFIQTRMGHDAEAVVLFEDALLAGARDYRIFANLGFSCARLGDNRRSLAFLKQAIDRAPDPNVPDPNVMEPQEKPAPTVQLTAVRSQIAEMDRPLELTLADSIFSVDDDDPRSVSSSDRWFNRGGGLLEADFRPAGLGYSKGRVLTLAGRLVWPNKPGTPYPEGNGLQAGIGFKYKPLRNSNLLFCSEYLLGLGEKRDNQTLLRIAHSSTTLPAGAHDGSRAGRGILQNITYRHHYTETGKTFGSGGYWFATHETRLGKAYFNHGADLLLPFVYLLGDCVLRDGSDFIQAETGAGLSLRWSGAFDRYRGDRRRAECLLRGGYIFYTDDGGPGWSLLLGLRLTLF